MATIDPTVLPKNVWTKVLTNVTTTGKVFIVDQEQDPTKYLVATVSPTGAAAPASDYDGIVFTGSVTPQNSTAIDVYIKPVNFDGKVIIYT